MVKPVAILFIKVIIWVEKIFQSHRALKNVENLIY